MIKKLYHFLQLTFKRIIPELFKLTTLQVVALSVMMAVLFSMVLVSIIDFLWYGSFRFNAELQLAGIVVPFIDSVLIVGLLVVLLDELREKVKQHIQAQEEIEFKNTILQTQQDTSLDAILVVDENEQIISYNQQFVDLWGLSPQIVSARQDAPVLQSVVVQVDNSEEFFARVQYLYEHRNEESHEEVQLKDGRIIDRYSAPVTGAHGKYYGRVWYFRDITERKRNEQERMDHLWYFEGIDRINHAIQGTHDLEQMMSDILNTVLNIFDCDRAWLVYPCDPEADSWQVPMERTKPEYPGALALGFEIPMEPGVADAFRTQLAADGPVKYGPGTGHPMPKDVSEQFGFMSFMSMALHPRGDKPWQFGIHQCSYPRVWTPNEEKLLLEISRRLTDALTSLSTYRDLLESEAKYRRIVEMAAEGIWMLGPDNKTTFANDRMAEILGYSCEEMIGRPMTDFMFEEDAPDHLRKMESRLQEQSENYERRFRCKDGQIMWTLVSATPIFDDKHCFQGTFGMFTNITESKRNEQELRIAATAFEAQEGIVVTDAHNVVLRVNQAFSRLTGYSAEEAIGQTPALLKSGRQDSEFYRQMWEALNLGHYWHGEIWNRRKNGEVFPEWLTITAVTNTEGQVTNYIGSFFDITQRKQAEQELRVAATAFETQEGIFISDAHNVILRINQAFSRLTGYDAEELVGLKPDILKSGRHDAQFYRDMWEALDRNHYWQGEIWNRYKSGEIHPGWLTITSVISAEGQITNYIGTYHDITQSKEADDKIHALAFYDPLTNLPNRRLLLDRLQHTLAASTRHETHGAVLFIDLDDFKRLNDTKGHNIGDLLLIEVANRLQGCVREGDTVARLGGDEFVVILEDLSEETSQAAAQTEAVCDKILPSIRLPYLLQGYAHYCSASIGISLFRGQEITVDELLKRADTAMYQAKNAGRNTLRFYDPAMQAALEARTALESDLRVALVEDQFKLYYQMQVDHTGHILGAEVLIRWQHPQRGLVSPLEFIPLAEETGLILPIGQWVLEAACARLKAWEAIPLTRDLQLAVNVSARQFRQPDFVEQVRLVLYKNELNPDRLKLELTESLVLDNIDDTIVKMQALREVGVRFSMDDFGTGYSSLSYLTQLPLDQLKIDQSFVRNIGTKSTDAVIVQTIIGMANNLEMEVIAEGVETEEQRAFLELNGCSFCQGYLFGRPVPVGEFEARLKSS